MSDDKPGGRYKLRFFSMGGISTLLIELNSFVIGRGEDADVVFNYEGISRTHLRVSNKDAIISIEDLHSSSGTRIDDKQLAPGKKYRYHPGELIKLGNANFFLTIEFVTITEVAIREKGMGQKLFDAVQASRAPETLHHWLESKLGEQIPMGASYRRALGNAIESLAYRDSQMNQEVTKTISAAKLLAAQIEAKATEEGKNIVANAREVTKDYEARSRAKTERHCEEIVESAKAYKEEVVKKVESILKDAKLKAESHVDQAKSKADSIHQEAQDHKAKAEKEAERILSEASTEAEQITAEVQLVRERLQKDLEKELGELRERKLVEIKKEEESIVAKANKEARERVDASIEAARKTADAAYAERSKLIAETKDAIEKERKQATAEAQQAAKKILDDAQISLEKFKEDSKKKIVELNKTLYALTQQCDKEKKTLSNTVESRKNLDKEIKVLREQTQEEVDKLLEKAKEEAKEIQKKAESDAGVLAKGAQLRIQSQIDQAEEEAEEIVSAAHEEGKDYLVKAKKEASEIAELAEQKSNEEIESARDRALEIVEVATEKAKEILESANLEAEHVVSSAEDKATNHANRLIEDAQNKAQKILHEAENKADSLRTKAKSESDILMKKATAESESLISQATSAAQKEIAEAKILKLELVTEQKELSAQKKELTEQVKELESKVTSATQELENLQKLISQSKDVHDKMEVAQKRYDSLLLEMEQQRIVLKRVEQEIAEKEKNIEKERDAWSHQLEEIKVELSVARSELDEVSEKIKISQSEHDKSLLAEREKFNKEKSAMEVELSQSLAQERLVRMKEIEEEAQKVERQMLSNKEDKIRRISQDIELEVIGYLKKKGLSVEEVQETGLLSQGIHAIVDNVLGQGVQKQKEDLQKIVDYDPESSRRLKRFWVKSAVASAAIVTLVVVVGIFRDEIPELGSEALSSIKNSKSASDIYLEKSLEKQRLESEFNPEMSAKFKKSFTDNVIYTNDYLQFEQSKEIRKKWIVELNEYLVEELGLSDNAVVAIVGKETRLMSRLSEMRSEIDGRYIASGVGRMRAVEDQFEKEVTEILGGKESYKKYLSFKEKFFGREK